MLHNINFFLDSLVKGDLKEVKGVSVKKSNVVDLVFCETVQLFLDIINLCIRKLQKLYDNYDNNFNTILIYIHFLSLGEKNMLLIQTYFSLRI